MDNILSKENLIETVKKLKEKNKKIVTTNGSFDILHPAHINLLKKANLEGDVLIVLLNSDDSIKRFKGDKRPFFNQEERALMISSLKLVDFVVIFDEDTPLDTLRRIKPDIHVKGGTFIKTRIKQEEKLLQSWNAKLKTFPLEGTYSTTLIINSILEKFKK